MLEKDLQQLIVDTARAMGLLVYHTHDSRRSQRGFPDLVIVGAQGVLYLELKTKTGKVTPEQRHWLLSLRAAGCTAHVIRPRHWPDEVLPLLKSLGGPPRVQPPQPSQAEIRKRVSGARKGPPAATV
jgi:hypothetical protein